MSQRTLQALNGPYRCPRPWFRQLCTFVVSRCRQKPPCGLGRRFPQQRGARRAGGVHEAQRRLRAPLLPVELESPPGRSLREAAPRLRGLLTPLVSGEEEPGRCRPSRGPGDSRNVRRGQTLPHPARAHRAEAVTPGCPGRVPRWLMALGGDITARFALPALGSPGRVGCQ